MLALFYIQTGVSRNALKQYFGNLVERGYPNRRGAGRGVWYERRRSGVKAKPAVRRKAAHRDANEAIVAPAVVVRSKIVPRAVW